MTNINAKILAPIKGRVIKFIEDQDFDKKYIYEKLGVASSNFRGNALYSEISSDVIAKILAFCPSVNTEWLLTGAGKMYKSDNVKVNSQSITGNSNIMSGNDSKINGDLKDVVKMLKLELQECKKELAKKEKEIRKKDGQIDTLINRMR